MWGCTYLNQIEIISASSLAFCIFLDEAEIRSLKVLIMEVPCCGGLVRLAEEALRRAKRDLPVECLVVGTQGHILGEYQIAG